MLGARESQEVVATARSEPEHPGRVSILRISPPDFDFGFERFQSELPLVARLPEVTQQVLVLRLVVHDSLRATLYGHVDVGRGEGKAQVEDFAVVADGLPVY